MVVKVCDVIMGAGKTESAITLMNQDTDSRYIFVTPYLEEVKRIKQSCPDRKFYEPKNIGDGKLDDLHTLLENGKNIATTHALFRTYTDTTISLIQSGGYKLILDEVFKTEEIVEISPKDLRMLQNEHKIRVLDTLQVEWVDSDYDGKFNLLRDMCYTGNVILYKNSLMLWQYPIDVFKSFRDVIILTYMFDAQMQKYYFDINGVDIQYIGTVYDRGEYHFSDYLCMPKYVSALADKVHILDDAKLNEIGDGYHNLSSTWYSRARKNGGAQLKQLRNNLINVFANRFSSSSNQNLWTVFKDYVELLKGKGYTKGFLHVNARATNAYRNRDHLAYCVNIFYNPLMKNYFIDHGCEVKEDQYALSEMIQWIWRSAIRDGKEIWIYIPSRRMRELLQNWLQDVSNPDSNE